MKPFLSVRRIAVFLCAAFLALHLAGVRANCQSTSAVAPTAKAAPAAAEPKSEWDRVRHMFGLTGAIRVRMEGGLGNDFALTPRDVYVVSRTRLGVFFKPSPYVRFYGEVQDARAMFYRAAPGSSLVDPFDWRQGYMEIGAEEGGRVNLRVGRQVMVLGSGRLVGEGDWSNVTKTFNVARATLAGSGYKMDLFGGSALLVDTTRMDRTKPGEHFYGSYLTLSKLLADTSVEPYVFLKTAHNVKSKDGKLGSTDTVYLGGRVTGKAPHSLDYSLEAVKEVGMYSTDAINAFGFVGSGGWTIKTAPWKPRISSEFIFATGDSGVADGHHQNFDYLYAPQLPNSLTGQFAWKNIKQWRTGVEIKPAKRLTVKVDFRDYWLATVKDSLYNSSGVKTVTNAKATSGHVGQGFDAQFVYSFNPKTSLGFGSANLTPGAYLTQSKKTTGWVYPYLFLTRKL